MNYPQPKKASGMHMSAIIPAPLRVSPQDHGFAIDNSAAIVVTDPSLRPLAERFAIDLRTDTGIALQVRDHVAGMDSASHPGQHVILLELREDDELAALPAVLGLSPHGGDPASERYGLDVTTQSARIW